ncbi:MAG: alpha/beta hydrolase [Microbacteriaceae bacterium]|nr:alpha/beta hydrolase [Microbacteriaceae bacterium]
MGNGGASGMTSAGRPEHLSLMARLLPTIFRLRGSKRIGSSTEKAVADVARLGRHPEKFAPPASVSRAVQARVTDVTGWPVYTLKARSSTSDLRVLFAHGGTWIHQISPFHWRFLEKLAVETGAEFIVPIYPLAPVGTAASVIPVFADFASDLVAQVGADKVTLLGDSAGGTIAIATAMTLRDRGVAAPHAIVLLAPAVDLSFTDPAIAAIAPTDPWLAVPGLRVGAELWRGQLPLDDWRVSPIHGDFIGLGDVTLFTGTRDIINPDAHTLVAALHRAGVAVDFHEKPGLLHNYPVLPIPEARPAQRVIATAIDGRGR